MQSLTVTLTLTSSVLGFLAGAIYSLYKARSYSHQCDDDEGGRFCKICNQHIPAKDHHCIWIDACISQYNMKYFLGFLACILVTLLQAGCIFLTSVCLPIREFGIPWILIPDKWCQRWNTHFEGDLRLTLTAGIHCLLLSIPICCLFIAKIYTYFIKYWQRRQQQQRTSNPKGL